MRVRCCALLILFAASASAQTRTVYRPEMTPVDRAVIWCVESPDPEVPDGKIYSPAPGLAGPLLADCWRTTRDPSTLRICDAACNPYCFKPCHTGQFCGPYISEPVRPQTETLTCKRVYSDSGELVATDEVHPLSTTHKPALPPVMVP